MQSKVLPSGLSASFFSCPVVSYLNKKTSIYLHSHSDTRPFYRISPRVVSVLHLVPLKLISEEWYPTGWFLAVLVLSSQSRASCSPAPCHVRTGCCMRLWCWILATGRNYSSQFCHWPNSKCPQQGHSSLAVYLSEVKKLLPAYLNLFGDVEPIKQTLNSLFFNTVHVSVCGKYCDVYCREAEIMETPSGKMKGKYQSMH